MYRFVIYVNAMRRRILGSLRVFFMSATANEDFSFCDCSQVHYNTPAILNWLLLCFFLLLPAKMLLVKPKRTLPPGIHTYRAEGRGTWVIRSSRHAIANSAAALGGEHTMCPKLPVSHCRKAAGFTRLTESIITMLLLQTVPDRQWRQVV